MSKRSGRTNDTDSRLAAKQAKTDDTVVTASAAADNTAEEENILSLSNKVFSQEGIVTNILSHLEISDICRCSEVSKTCLKSISRLEELHIIADTSSVGQKLHFAVIRFCSENNLRRLHMNLIGQNIPDDDERIKKIVFSCKNKLTHVHIEGFLFPFYLFRQFPKMKEFEMRL